MMHTMFARLNKKVSDEKVVYRDELIKKKSSPGRKGVKKSVRFADPEPSKLEKEKEKEMVKGKCGSPNELGEKAGIRVKLKMTKEEAARLLSKCKEGGVLEFKDVARELATLPLNRVSVLSTPQEQ